MKDSDPRSRRHRPPTWRSLVVLVATAAALCVYLFVSAPPPLAAEPAGARQIPMRAVFAILQRENAAARAVWTQEIVARGTTAGLAFDERWRDDAVLAGPLPALFLRETARNLARTAPGLNLFLGSEHALNPANRFSGEQEEHFAALVESGTPQQFVDPTTNLQTAMFADVAVSEACVSCHNDHAGAPKTDWRLHDVMGAATWMYPEASISVDRAIELVRALRSSIRDTYSAYLAKVATFPQRPQIGARWPRDGFALPSEDVFMRELARRSSSATLLALLDPDAGESALAEPAPPPAAAPVPASPPPAAVPAPTPKPAPDTLVLRSTRSTRVVVEHAGSRLLVARLVPGSVTTISSPPPLRVQLSDPDGVDVEYATRKIAGPDKDVEVVVATASRERS